MLRRPTSPADIPQRPLNVSGRLRASLVCCHGTSALLLAMPSQPITTRLSSIKKYQESRAANSLSAWHAGACWKIGHGQTDLKLAIDNDVQLVGVVALGDDLHLPTPLQSAGSATEADTLQARGASAHTWEHTPVALVTRMQP